MAFGANQTTIERRERREFRESTFVFAQRVSRRGGGGVLVFSQSSLAVDDRRHDDGHHGGTDEEVDGAELRVDDDEEERQEEHGEDGRHDLEAAVADLLRRAPADVVDGRLAAAAAAPRFWIRWRVFKCPHCERLCQILHGNAAVASLPSARIDQGTPTNVCVAEGKALRQSALADREETIITIMIIGVRRRVSLITLMHFIINGVQVLVTIHYGLSGRRILLRESAHCYTQRAGRQICPIT